MNMITIADTKFIFEVGGVFVTATVALAGAIFYASKSGAVTEKVIKTYKDLSDANDRRITELDRSLTEWKKRTEVCEGLHRDNLTKTGEMIGTINTLKEVLENRNPEMKIFMQNSTRIAEEAEVYMKGSLGIFSELKDFMYNINERMRQEASLKK